MTKSEIIYQLKSLRDSTIDYAKGNNNQIFKKDIEALDAVLDFLNQTDHDSRPEDDLVPDYVPVIRCKHCTKWERYNNTAGAGYCHHRNKFATVTMPDDFCSHGIDKKNIFSPSNHDSRWRGGQALDLAKYIVTKCVRDKKCISNSQLCRILYIVQRESLKHSKRAFDDKFEAWAFGAVIVNVYYYFCGNGAMPIISTYDVKPPKNQSFIDKIVEKTREMEPLALNKLAYPRRCAWELTFDKGRGNRKIIPDDLILRYG